MPSPYHYTGYAVPKTVQERYKRAAPTRQAGQGTIGFPFSPTQVTLEAPNGTSYSIPMGDAEVVRSGTNRAGALVAGNTGSSLNLTALLDQVEAKARSGVLHRDHRDPGPEFKKAVAAWAYKYGTRHDAGTRARQMSNGTIPLRVLDIGGVRHGIFYKSSGKPYMGGQPMYWGVKKLRTREFIGTVALRKIWDAAKKIACAASQNPLAQAAAITYASEAEAAQAMNMVISTSCGAGSQMMPLPQQSMLPMLLIGGAGLAALLLLK